MSAANSHGSLQRPDLGARRDRPDPRVVRSRRLLRRALFELVSEMAFDAITVQDIADRAEVNRATLYLHYQDKYDLLEDVFRELVRDLAPLPPETPDGQAEFEVVPQLARMIEHFARNDGFYRALLGDKGEPAFTSHVRSYIEGVVLAWINALQPDTTAQPVRTDIVATFVTSACLGVIVWWLKNDMPDTPTQLAVQIARCTLGLSCALGTPLTWEPRPPAGG